MKNIYNNDNNGSGYKIILILVITILMKNSNNDDDGSFAKHFNHQHWGLLRPPPPPPPPLEAEAKEATAATWPTIDYEDCPSSRRTRDLDVDKRDHHRRWRLSYSSRSRSRSHSIKYSIAEDTARDGCKSRVSCGRRHEDDSKCDSKVEVSSEECGGRAWDDGRCRAGNENSRGEGKYCKKYKFKGGSETVPKGQAILCIPTISRNNYLTLSI